MAAALLFWGWENGLLILGVVLAAVVEGARWTRMRWEMSDGDLNRVADLCWAVLVGTALLLYSTGDRLLFLFKLVEWLPVCFGPLMLAQAYGNRPTMPLSVFWWLLRRSPTGATARKSYNISYCYFSIVLLAASCSTQPNGFFYAGVTLLVALALTSTRPKRVSVTVWIVLLAVAATAGQFSHRELRTMQNAMETALGAWLSDFFGRQPDQRELPTRIGVAGQIPQSGKIVYRLRPEPGAFAPSLLRETTWDAYRKSSWLASNNDFMPARMGYNNSCRLLPTNFLCSEVEIAGYFDGGQGVLALPHGTCEINLDSAQADVKTNRLGVMEVDDGPGLLDFRATFAPGRSIDSPPCDRDLMVPDEERPMLAKVAADLKLAGMKDRQKVRAIEHFFTTGFTYSLDPPLCPERTNALGYFLTRSHSGHCQYYATATVLLLRQAGIPARYVTGYIVKESGRHGDTYLVRARDAHAWTLAYHRDTKLWEQIDTTPGNRDESAAAPLPWWEPASDALSNLYFEFSKWRWSKTSLARYSIWLLVPTILYLLGRILFSQRRQRSGLPGDGGPPQWQGADSELYLIDQRLGAAQLSRLPNEPLLSWQQRLEAALPDTVRLRRIFHLHRSLRFDPRGLKKDDRQTLREESQRWLADFTARMERQKQSAPSDRLRASG
jgi:hypothetical protein